MIESKEILAKSRNYGNLSLFDHTFQVAKAIVRFAKGFEYPFDESLAWKAAILHDLGKAHPHFQRKIQSVNNRASLQSLEWNFIHRHELSSLAFLPLFPKEEWNILIDLVVAHHKSIKDDVKGRGILDLDDNYRDWIPNHLKHWHEWQEYALEILNSFEIATREISYTEAEQALKYTADYCNKKKSGWSPWRGLLKSADHFASAFMHDTEAQLKPLFEIPDLSYYHKEERKNNLYPLSKIPTEDPRKHTLVVAPTGAGKTDFLLRRCKGRVFYTLPFQASINAMYERIKAVVPNKDVRLLHATSKIVVKDRVDERILQPLAGSSVKILTPHQLAAIIFGTSGFESIILDIQGIDVILDEIHTYSDYSQAMVLEIVKALIWLDCRIHIGTATMPTVLYTELLNLLGGEESVYEVKLRSEILDTFDRHKVFKIEESQINNILTEGFYENEKVLLIYNTVKEAQKAYETAIENFPSVPTMLIHSRFRRSDRVALESRLKNEFNGDGKELKNGLQPCLVISTQVVEVSLDISFDRMITQCAPLDALIQRFGRINRKRSENTIGTYKPVHVLKPAGNSLPYKKEVLEASFAQLPDNSEILKENSLQEKIDKVYPVLNKKEIEVHLKFKDGKFLLRELTDNPKAVIVEALEIESATCILENDREKYESANWLERLGLEIPVNWKSIARNKAEYIQLEIGSWPFVVPQDPEEHKVLGLRLVEHENVL